MSRYQEYETCIPLAVHSLGHYMGFLAVALYIYHIYYNNTFFALFFTMLHLQLSPI